MAGKSKIEWTEQTWNPIVGCSIVSPGCTNCYAMQMAGRIEAMGNQPRYAGTTRKVNGHIVWTGKLAQAPEATLLAPLRRKIPTTYFVNSMGDLFHEDCPDDWIDRVFAVMALCPQHTFQVLTKRAARMREYLTKPHHPGQFITILDDGRWIDTPGANIRARSAMCDIMPKAPARALNDACAWQDRKYPYGDGFMREWPLPNVWLGVSAERQQEADERIPLLLDTPAAVRFISAEPLLGPIDLTEWLRDGHPTQEQVDGPLGAHYLRHGSPRLDWVIVGGESGPNARPMHPDWARSLRDQCAAAGVAFFFKQWGEWRPHKILPGDHLGDEVRSGRVKIVHPTGQSDVDVFVETAGRNTVPGSRYMARVGKKAAGRLLDGIEHNAMPEALR